MRHSLFFRAECGQLRCLCGNEIILQVELPISLTRDYQISPYDIVYAAHISFKIIFIQIVFPQNFGMSH